MLLFRLRSPQLDASLEQTVLIVPGEQSKSTLDPPQGEEGKDERGGERKTVSLSLTFSDALGYIDSSRRRKKDRFTAHVMYAVCSVPAH